MQPRMTPQACPSCASALKVALGVSEWTEQSDNGALSSRYGMLRLSVTRNGERGGLALGIEVFRNERGEVLGSPTRGDGVDANGVHRCSAKSPQQIADFFEMYGQREGAEPFESDQFRGFTNRITQPMVAFVTRPTHPAHPAIITRGVERRDGAVYVTASGDFAGDCQAFLELLDQVRRMNENLRPQR